MRTPNVLGSHQADGRASKKASEYHARPHARQNCNAMPSMMPLYKITKNNCQPLNNENNAYETILHTTTRAASGYMHLIAAPPHHMLLADYMYGLYSTVPPSSPRPIYKNATITSSHGNF